MTTEQGGRRGRAQVRTGAGGLTWAVSRHATTRAGDPQPHDHVLITNVVAMGDTRGGWKGLDTALLRDHLHAATAIGRLAAAAKAVELGYGIEPDPGPSGRLGSFAISGIPKEAWEVHATRSAQIDAAVGPGGVLPGALDGAPAPPGTKRSTRWPRTSCPVGGPNWPRPVTRRPSWRPPWNGPAGRTRHLGLSSSTSWRRAAWPRRAPGGREDFDLRDAVVAVAPLLHGLPVSILDTAVQKVLSDERAVALPAVVGARGPVWAAACVLEDERRVAELADLLVERRSPAVRPSWRGNAVPGQSWPEAPVSMRDKAKWPNTCSPPGIRLTS